MTALPAIPIRRVAVIGTGVIGASWAVHFLANGLEVVCTSPEPDGDRLLRTAVNDFWPAARRITPGPGPIPMDQLQFTSNLTEAVSQADFVQENGPERVDFKRQLFQTMDSVARPHVVLASSSSGLTPSQISADCHNHPGRVLVGHPFNPPHLIPLVEVVPGVRTSIASVDTAMSFYRSTGKCPILLRQELPGHVANRLQAALWREAYSLVERGVVTVSDIDTAISQGPGLRWAVLGPFANQHLSGGPGGLTHVLEHLGPPMVDWWNDLGQPELTPQLIATLAAGVQEELAGIDPASLVADRDSVIEAMIAAKKGTNLP